MEILLVIILIIVIVGLYSYWSDLTKDKGKAEEKLTSLENQVSNIINSKLDVEKNIEKLKTDKEKLTKIQKDLDQLVSQRSKGFPLIGEVYEEYFDVLSKIQQGWLRRKKNPAYKAADVVKEVTNEKKDLVKQLKIIKYKLKNYELIAPFLTEIDEEIPHEEDAWMLRDYSEEELEDETTKYLTKEEYRKLSTPEKNQLALDRYWGRGKKSLWLIGKMYEHYIGYLYEQKGWDVEYFGIAERYEDFGRDLIATKGKKCHIIQCKNWSKYKKIYENHIFQLFGTTFEYQGQHPKLEVLPVFYTSTVLSDTATEFSKRLGMEINTSTKLEKYPCIKCNISKKNKEKIYHLPFDLNYDSVKIEPKRGEFYAENIKQAEEAGFRRAYKWHGDKKTIAV